MFDINTLALKKDTFPLHLAHPATGEPLFADAEGKKPVRIHVYGTASKEYRDAVKGMQNRQLKRGKNKTATVAEIQEEAIELLVAISDTSDELEYEGKSVTTPAVFRELYADSRFSWVREQVDAAVSEVANFLDK